MTGLHFLHINSPVCLPGGGRLPGALLMSLALRWDGWDSCDRQLPCWDPQRAPGPMPCAVLASLKHLLGCQRTPTPGCVGHGGSPSEVSSLTSPPNHSADPTRPRDSGRLGPEETATPWRPHLSVRWVQAQEMMKILVRIQMAPGCHRSGLMLTPPTPALPAWPRLDRLHPLWEANTHPSPSPGHTTTRPECRACLALPCQRGRLLPCQEGRGDRAATIGPGAPRRCSPHQTVGGRCWPCLCPQTGVSLLQRWSFWPADDGAPWDSDSRAQSVLESPGAS